VYGDLAAAGSQLIFTPAAQPGQPGLEESTWHEHPGGTRIAGVTDVFDVPMAGVYTWTFEGGSVTASLPFLQVGNPPRPSICIDSAPNLWYPSQKKETGGFRG
jgi:hypothetical protein